ncbi:2-iminoacetate synthase ThiH [Chengkuizengella axinellae]|uniref:2-iminoacetate synthase ThiH n=1 Tax=Chengkuizengella axinellae TaxID=3064388 RepID=A0ABT9IYS9_9BACL|nr:2-iminoacetate synthase ThiH [Chengkuizengella sp. 2205SS18-9]MDP5274507.1 2-iminoacetate synthase ThiH [Chengkuizengella sp. 2205SS18-9]
MGFYETLKELEYTPFESIFSSISSAEIERILQKKYVNDADFLTLLSPAAIPFLDVLAKRAGETTAEHFNKKIVLYAPLYISDHCVNHCDYCSFSVIHTFERKRLSIPEIELEANVLKEKGIQHVVVLTGESKAHVSYSFFKKVIEILKDKFESVSIEIQPLESHQYEELRVNGVDGLTVYQEVYDEEIYKKVHIKGPKRNYLYRLDTAERACKAGVSNVNIGALLGLGEWRKEAFFTAMHVKYLQTKYPKTQIGISFPRIRPHIGEFEPAVNVTDENLIQIMLATRLFLPKSPMNISTRENPTLRDQLISFGVTNMSAASSTAVGGYVKQESMENTNYQFDISDERSVNDIATMLKQKGFIPVVNP